MTVFDIRPATPAPRDEDGRRRRLLLRAAVGSAAFGAVSFAVPALSEAAAADAPTIEATLQDDVPFWFGFIGDTPYSRLEENSLRLIMSALAAEPLEFVLHAGDIKSSLEGCDDELMSSRLRLLDDCPHPLILTPGDNEWTDCNRSLPAWQPGGALERLDWLRARAFRHPLSLGRRRMRLEQQGAYLPATAEGVAVPRQVSDQASPRLPENLRWRIGSLQFCTLHVVGSGNGESRQADLAQAWLLRQQANGDWLNDTVQQAVRENAAGLVIALHANLRFGAHRSDGWERMRSLIIAAAVAFDGPVLLLHGDTHHFRNDRLLRRSHGLVNFQRVECFGSPFSSSWVQIRWDPALAKAGAGTESDPFQVSTRALP